MDRSDAAANRPRQRLPPSSPCSSLAEEIAMRPCAFETDRIFAGRAYENPVGFDMDVATRSPFALQRVVAQFGGQGASGNQKCDHVAKFLQILAALLREFDIAFELAGE